MKLMNPPKLLEQILDLYCKSPRIAILMSGKGSNADMILSSAHRYPNLNFITICTDKKTSNGRKISDKHGLDYFCFEAAVNTVSKRDIYFKKLAMYLSENKIDTLIYAGFMKISPQFFVKQFPGINVHPADLTINDSLGKPKYTGMYAIQDAIADGAAYLASTAHVVEADVDCGSPIMVSKHLLLEGRNIRDISSLHENLKISCEHLLYPRLLELMSKGMLLADHTPYRWDTLENKMKINNGRYFANKLLGIKDLTTPLDLAYLAQYYSSEVGFDFTSIEQVMTKVKEEFNELTEAFNNRQHGFHHFVEEIGDCFFSLINLCRFIELHPEAVVKRNALKYLDRCQYIENQLKIENRDWSLLTPIDIKNLWKKAKKNERD